MKDSIELVILGVEINIRNIKFIDLEQCYPSLFIIFDNSNQFTLIPSSFEANSGIEWKIKDSIQIFLTINAFEKINFWKVILDLLSPTDPTPLGTLSFDIHKLIRDALGKRGESQKMNIKSNFTDIVYNNKIAEINFDIKLIYFKNLYKKPAIEIINSDKILTPEKIYLKRPK